MSATCCAVWDACCTLDVIGRALGGGVLSQRHQASSPEGGKGVCVVSLHVLHVLHVLNARSAADNRLHSSAVWCFVCADNSNAATAGVLSEPGSGTSKFEKMLIKNTTTANAFQDMFNADF